MNLKDFSIRDGKMHPAIIICPGGGYTHLSNHEGDNVAQKLNTYGISCFVLEYGFTWPRPLADAKRAIRYVRSNAEKYNVYENKIGIMGFSAGAHLAGMCGEFFDKFEEESEISAKPDVCCLCYPVVTLTKNYGHTGSKIMLNGNESLAETLSLENSVREDMPPVFIWHTFEDKSVSMENSLELAKALKAKNVICELHIFPRGRHGSDLAENIPGTSQWVDLFINFLNRQNFV